ncbi:MAG TPA: histidine--tRNA ligase [Methylomirabilota bacterium]|nr:histidine--tRNA ligase [Methylomirabilota bacterium]
MRDVLPGEVTLRDWAMAQILTVYRRHGFVRIETPAVESLRLLLRSEGGENEKLIYKILKRGERLATAAGAELADLGLRFDLTVPLVRYYAHNHSRLPQPLKAIQIGPVWRAERPQQGRYRQFTQCDIDILGVASEVAEIELILATTEALAALGLKDLTVRLNDRRVLGAMVAHCGFDPERSGSVFIALDKLDKVGREEVAAELQAAGHAPDAGGRLLDLLGTVATPSSLRALLGARVEDTVWAALQRILDTTETQAAGRFRLVFDATLVRGMGYYTGPIFEVQQGDSMSSIAGGGRYDRMIGRFIGRDVPATGFSIGFERVIGLLVERGSPVETDGERVALVFDEAMPALGPVLALARDLREQGKQVLLETRTKRLGKQLQDLETRGFRKIGVVTEAGSVEWREPRGRRGGEARA